MKRIIKMNDDCDTVLDVTTIRMCQRVDTIGMKNYRVIKVLFQTDLFIELIYSSFSNRVWLSDYFTILASLETIKNDF